MAKVKIVTAFPTHKVQIVKLESQADLLVYWVKAKNDAKGDELWFEDKSFGDVKIQYSPNGGDLKVFFVENKSKAGWKNKAHRLQGRLG